MRISILTLMIPAILSLSGCVGSCMRGDGGCGGGLSGAAVPAIGPLSMVRYANSVNTFSGNGCGEVYRGSWYNNPPREKPYDLCGRSLYPSEHYYRPAATNGYYRGRPVTKCTRGSVSRDPCFCDSCQSQRMTQTQNLAYSPQGYGVTQNYAMAPQGTVVQGMTVGEMGMYGGGGTYGGIHSGGMYAGGYDMGGMQPVSMGTMDGMTGYPINGGTIMGVGDGRSVPYANQNALGATASPGYVAPLAPGPSLSMARPAVRPVAPTQVPRTPMTTSAVMPASATVRGNTAGNTGPVAPAVAVTEAPRHGGIVPQNMSTFSGIPQSPSVRTVGAELRTETGTGTPMGMVTRPETGALSSRQAVAPIQDPFGDRRQSVANPGSTAPDVATSSVQTTSDEESGIPAGIRDPEYQAKMLASLPFDPQLQPGQYIVSVSVGPDTPVQNVAMAPVQSTVPVQNRAVTSVQNVAMAP
ncbi:MAG: hypothetical protein Q4C47_05555, partial [Planctomycetia bacterium]|nr:hypothetical protein [Planctomycetia bacterium]